MKKLTLKQLEEHQKETLDTLNKEYEIAWKEAQEAMDKIYIINSTIAKFQTQIFMAQQFGKKEENN